MRAVLAIIEGLQKKKHGWLEIVLYLLGGVLLLGLVGQYLGIIISND